MSIIEGINSPADLKRLSQQQLLLLANELRADIISVVSRTGGHLASSLGAVELSIALHYVLDSPKDAVVWDVGHQAYAHKLLTGRRDQFKTLRQKDGISGFPYHKESEYDPFTVGHSSTAVSLALGLAIANPFKHKDSKVVAVVGDGSLTGGMCLEALNHAGHSDADLLVVLNSNNMAISPVQGAMGKYVNKIISTNLYNKLHEKVKNILLSMPAGRKIVDLGGRIEEALKGIVVPGLLFEEFGFRYFGPIDGHNLPLLIETFNDILPLKGPKLLHVITKKGKGYSFAEKNPTLFHGVGAFDIDTGVVKKSSARTYTNAFTDAALMLAEKGDVLFITAAMLDGTGLAPVKAKFPKNVIDVGIAEQHAVSLSAGMSRAGTMPVVAIYSTFLQRSYDQILEDVCLQDVGVIFAIDRAGLVGEDGIMHHGIMDIAFLRPMPKMHLLCPRDEESMRKLFEWAYKIAKSEKVPVALRYPRAVLKDSAVSFFNIDEVKTGRGQVLRYGAEGLIMCLGPSVIDVMDIVEEEKLDLTVVDAVFAAPIDYDWIKGLEGCKKILTIEEGVLDGGWGQAIKAKLAGKSVVENVGLENKFYEHAKRDELLKSVGIDKDSLCIRIKNFFDEKT